MFSAGSEPSQVHPMAVQVMGEMKIDIRQQLSKHLDEFRARKFDYIITVCDRVREVCPVFPGDPDLIFLQKTGQIPPAISMPTAASRLAGAMSIAPRLRRSMRATLSVPAPAPPPPLDSRDNSSPDQFQYYLRSPVPRAPSPMRRATSQKTDGLWCPARRRLRLQ